MELTITSVPEQVSNILLPKENGIVTDRNCIVFHAKANIRVPTKLNRHVYNYKKGDFQGLRSTLQNIDFSNIMERGRNVDMAWQVYTNEKDKG